MINIELFDDSLFQTEVKITAEMLYYMTLSNDDVETLMILPRVKEELISYIIDNLNLTATKSEGDYNTIVYNMKLYAFTKEKFEKVVCRINLLEKNKKDLEDNVTALQMQINLLENKLLVAYED